MEVGKVEKFDLSKIGVRETKASPLRTRIEGLDVGQGFVVEGIERGTINHITALLHKEGRRIVVHKLAIGKFQVVRVK